MGCLQRQHLICRCRQPVDQIGLPVLGEAKQALFDNGNDSAAGALVETIHLLPA